MNTMVSKSPIRLIDIARRAGVSAVAVSKVLHNRGGNRTRVSETTAEKIRAIASELNYRPNMAAQQLAGVRSYLIGGILDSHANETFIKRLAVMERAAADRGYRLIVGYSHNEVERIADYLNDFRSRGVDGVVSLSHTYPEYGGKISQMLQGFKNCVLIEPPVGEANLSYVSPDYVKTGYIITKHLLEEGFKRIAILQFAAGYKTVQDEFQGYLKALQEAEVAFDPELIIEPEEAENLTFEMMKRNIDKLLAVRPDAVITPNDATAMWVIRTLNKCGLRVPEDMAVASVDGWEIGQSYVPAITSVDLRYQEVGLAAIDMLLEQIESPEAEHRVHRKIIEPKLVIGESCERSNK
ncbi:MAG: LacI family transcriptional regulator [Phycisphaerae bacterium]|jgi:DNA-binding LacI/PurR family transcriptional regulator|nr:LacI family transcriptional regulator [Phycisphaerae bacterium]